MSKVTQYLNDRVTSMLTNGMIPWRKTWTSKGLKPMSITGHAYRGINLFLFSMLGHAVPVYITFNQIKKMGGTIKDDAKDKYYPVYFYSMLEKDKTDPAAGKIPIFRYFNVWNIEDVDGIKLPPKIQKQLEWKASHDASPIEDAVKLVDGYKDAPTIAHGGDAACYSPTLDKISMPAPEMFENMGEYYVTLFHEMGHSTGHAKRLNREELMKMTGFGSHEYSREELVAEMTAAMLAGECGITTEFMLDNSAAYLAAWMKKIKDEPNILITAASRAQKAVDHIMGTTFDNGESAD